MRKKRTPVVDLFFSMNASKASEASFGGVDEFGLARSSPVQGSQGLRRMGLQSLPQCAPERLVQRFRLQGRLGPLAIPSPLALRDSAKMGHRSVLPGPSTIEGGQ